MCKGQLWIPVVVATHPQQCWLCVQLMPELKQAGEKAIDMMYTLMGLHNLLLSPPVDNPRNVIDAGLFTVLHKVSTGLVVRAPLTPAAATLTVPCRSLRHGLLRLVQSHCLHLIHTYGVFELEQEQPHSLLAQTRPTEYCILAAYRSTWRPSLHQA
jgi:hypothetical protein